MIKIFKILIIYLFLSNCSFNDSTGFWSKDEEIKKRNLLFKPVFEKVIGYPKEFNTDLKLELLLAKIDSNSHNNLGNNNGLIDFNINLNKQSEYRFSKIKNYHLTDSELVFDKNDIFFFDNKGSILKFGENSNLKWKKNIYTKNEKKLHPLINLYKYKNSLIVSDNLSKYYSLNIDTGEVNWLKMNKSPFNSQIKVFNDRIFIIDAENILRCFSIKNGEELWNYSTEKPFVNSFKNLSIVIKDQSVTFVNSIGEITSLNHENGKLKWQNNIFKSDIIEEIMDLKISELVIENKTLYVSNNNNKFYALDINTGRINWEQSINSHLKPLFIDNFLITISDQGYLYVLDKKNGNIIRANKLYDNSKIKKKKRLKPVGFVSNGKEIYLSTNRGKLLVIDLKNGKVREILNIARNRISRPIVKNGNLYLVKDNSIIRLN